MQVDFCGKRRPVEARPRRWRSRCSSSSESPRSSTVKSGRARSAPRGCAAGGRRRCGRCRTRAASAACARGRQAEAASCRARGRRAAPSRRRRAARTSATGCATGRRRASTSMATRAASVMVLPEPAPATTSSGPCVGEGVEAVRRAASRCASLRPPSVPAETRSPMSGERCLATRRSEARPGVGDGQGKHGSTGM